MPNVGRAAAAGMPVINAQSPRRGPRAVITIHSVQTPAARNFQLLRHHQHRCHCSYCCDHIAISVSISHHVTATDAPPESIAPPTVRPSVLHSPLFHHRQR